MTRKKKIIMRLNILYCIFFGIVIASSISVLFGNEERESFKEGYESGGLSNMVLDLPLIRISGVYEQPLMQNPDSTIIIKGRTTSMDIQINGKKAFTESKPLVWCILLRLVAFFGVLAILVIVFIMLLALKSSVKSGNIFNHDNILFTRIIGVLLIASSLIEDWAHYLEIKVAMRLLESTPLQFSTEVFTFRNIFLGILILVIAEIFAIGHDISEDQKLTV